jgi:Ras-related protein Rab-2A
MVYEPFMSGRSVEVVQRKVVMVGPPAVGKSCLIERAVRNQFIEGDMVTVTLGAVVSTFSCPVDNQTVRLDIWDTAGAEKFRSLTKSYFRGAVGALLVYDITNLESFDSLIPWLRDLHDQAMPNVYVLLVGNKTDREAERQVGREVVEQFCAEHRLVAVETSAKDGSGAREAFARLASEVYHRSKMEEVAHRQSAELHVDIEGRRNDKKSCC